MPPVPDMVDLGDSPWHDHSATSMPQVRQASPRAASPALVWPWTSSRMETY